MAGHVKPRPLPPCPSTRFYDIKMASNKNIIMHAQDETERA